MTCAILPASEELVAEIEVWLDAEEAKYEVAEAAWSEAGYIGEKPQRGFRCNWNTVKKGWRERETPLDVLVNDGEAVGFLFGTDILEIHPEHRGQGLGILLSDHMIQRATDEGYCVLEIQIAPTTAKPFWLRQGFLLKDERDFGDLYAYMIIPRSFKLGSGPRASVRIMYYDESTFYSKGNPFFTFEGEGERTPDGFIQLPERVTGYSPLLENNIDNHISIAVNGEEIYSGRSKYGQEYGTRRDPHGHHYINRILLGSFTV